VKGAETPTLPYGRLRRFSNPETLHGIATAILRVWRGSILARELCRRAGSEMLALAEHFQSAGSYSVSVDGCERNGGGAL
jgi:hypothetical protein